MIKVSFQCRQCLKEIGPFTSVGVTLPQYPHTFLPWTVNGREHEEPWPFCSGKCVVEYVSDYIREN